MDPATIALIGSGVMSLFSGDGGQDAAAAAQAAQSAEMLKMYKKREAVELPFRKNLLQSLAQRSRKQFPGMTMPTTPPVFDPFKNMRTSMALGAEPAQAGGKRGAQTLRGMGGVNSFLNKRQVRPVQ